MARLQSYNLTLAYDGEPVVRELTLAVPEGRITVVVGPNACGKSTLLRALARLLRPVSGTVVLDGEQIDRLPTKEVARRLGLLPQTPTAPEGLTVEDLVGRGRFPHQGLFRRWSRSDEEAVARALDLAGMTALADRRVDELSGGQRQRAWVAMALAQDTPVMLLDEPTTHLDVAYQLEVLDVVRRLNEAEGRTVVMVLHDLNQAARYGHHLVGMAAGRIVAEGPPREVVTERFVEEVFGVEARVIAAPVTGAPLVVPVGLGRRAETGREEAS